MKTQLKMEVKNTANKFAESYDSEAILDYYKNWNSDNCPVMLVLDSYYEYPGDIESEDQIKMSYLRKKYKK